MIKLFLIFLCSGILGYIGVIVKEKVSKKQAINELKKEINEFIRQYDIYKDVLFKEINDEELFNFLKAKCMEDSKMIFPVPVKIFKKTVFTFNPSQLRVILKTKAECIMYFQDILEEKYNIKIDNIVLREYQEFIKRVIELSNICYRLDRY